MLEELVPREPEVDRDAVAEEIERGILEPRQATPVRRLDPCVTDVPLPRHDPVEDLGSRRRLDDVEREVAPDDREGLSHSVTCEAPREREELANQIVKFLSDAVVTRDWMSNRSASVRRPPLRAARL